MNCAGYFQLFDFINLNPSAHSAFCTTVHDNHSKSRKSPAYFAGEVAVISDDAEINETILRNISGIYC